jgi:hypothetical protein
MRLLLLLLVVTCGVQVEQFLPAVESAGLL